MPRLVLIKVASSRAYQDREREDDTQNDRDANGSVVREHAPDGASDVRKDYLALVEKAFELACASHANPVASRSTDPRTKCDVLRLTFDQVSPAALERGFANLECEKCRKYVAGAMCSCTDRSAYIVARHGYSAAYDEIIARDDASFEYVAGAYVGACESLDITRALALILRFASMIHDVERVQRDGRDPVDESLSPTKVMRDGLTAAACSSACADEVSDLIACLCPHCVTTRVGCCAHINIRGVLSWTMRDDVIEYMEYEKIRALEY
jgi:hypothetical protein